MIMSDRNQEIKEAIEYSQERICMVTDEIAADVIRKFKEGCNNYKEVLEKVELFEKNIKYHMLIDKSCVYLLGRIKYLINEEMNDLPLTNRP